MWELNVKLDEDESLNKDFKSVFADITNEYENLVSQGPPLGYKEIEVMRGGPMCPINFLPERYQILLNFDVKSRFYDQAAYQFAHELCHIYCDPRISNRFIESICKLSSLYLLEYLNDKWQLNPPYPNWKKYAPNFTDYKDKIISKVELDLKEYSEIKNIMNSTKVLTSIEERNLQLITAQKLLPIFQKSSKAWLLLPTFGKFSYPQPKENNNLSGGEGIDFETLSSSLSVELKEIVKDILNVIQYGSDKLSNGSQ